jgi:enoyl-CoA hydratase
MNDARPVPPAGQPAVPSGSPGPADPVLLVERTTWGVRLVLNRPAKLNAISAEVRDALVGALAEAADDDRVRVIAIAGAGRAFCSGYDLSEAAPTSAWGWRDVLARDVAATLAIWSCPKPVIAQVHGFVLAGGLELAMACDLIVAADDAQLGEPEIRFGSAPVTLLMPFLVGQKKTRELLMTGDLIGAAEAERIGLVNRVVPAGELVGAVDVLADRLARVPPDVMAPTKLMLNRAMDAAGFAAAVELGLDLQSFVNMSETAREFDAIVRREGLRAALAWRDARYDERLAGDGRKPGATAVSSPRRRSTSGRASPRSRTPKP